MTKVGIITFLHNENYGSSLQAYALQRVIREMGYDCEHIDYQPDTAEKLRNLLGSRNHPSLILEGLKKRSVKAEQTGAREKSRAIPEFYARTMRLSAPCRNRGELAKTARQYDILVCGSDQIWNPVWMNPAYFLTFAPEGCRKVAYAPSLGIRTMPAKGKTRLIREWTKGFAALSVREKEGAELMERMTGLRPEVMPDPVCLMDREAWAQAAGNGDAGDGIPEEPFLLCYFIGDREDYWERVQALQESTGLKPLVIPVTERSYRCPWDKLEGAGPQTFVRAIAGADMVCTDSFHGLAFATLFGKKTELIRRYREDDPESKNSRVDHFLRSTEREGLEAMRERGLTWLRRALEQE